MSAGAAETALRAAWERAAQLVAGTPLEARVAAVRDRLDGPLRVALAGRLKAGKSTLLNALVGERVAPTDAGECTRLVTWYQEGLRYRVRASLVGGGEQELRFDRSERAIDIDLDGVDPAGVDRLVVEWPSSRLSDLTLIDTPGLASNDETVSERTRDALGVGREGAPDADAVVYLMRHVHHTDADFLEAFVDPSVGTPVNTVGVLSRADEIGSGRLDAMESAGRIAERLAADPRIAALCSTVVAVAGLVAETGQTLTESEFRSMRAVAALPPDERSRLLLTADRFVGADIEGTSRDDRRRLLARLGGFGLRFAAEQIAAGAASTTAELASALVEVSGFAQLQAVLRDRIEPRARALKVRSVLLELGAVVGELSATDTVGAAQLERLLEEARASSHEFAELRASHLVMAGYTDLSAAEAADLLQLLTAPTPAERLGLDASRGLDAVSTEALSAVERWRQRGADPLSDPLTVEACEVAARSAEGLYAGANPT
ncbi:MAG: dynamin family protein [Actinobacteria bacterium]|nr:dynamin family protein [Actinomycetota bacterium]